MPIYPLALRQMAVAACERDKESVADVAARFGVGARTLWAWLQRHREGLDLAPRHGGGHPRVLDAAEREKLRELVAARPRATLHELRELIASETGKVPSTMTLQRYLRELRIGRRRPVVADEAATQKAPSRDGYQAEHRVVPATGYPSSLTDAEWEVLRPIFEREGGRGRPSEYSRRALLDAIFYVVRSGGAWRMLPRDFPPWELAYMTFRRWAKAGLFEKMHDELRRMWRTREGRNAEPSAGIVDSQSVKSTEKGGPEGSMGAKK